MLDVPTRVVELAVVLVMAPIAIKIIDMVLTDVFNITRFDPTLEKFAHKTIVTILWLFTLAVLLVISGVDVTAVVASVGVGSFIIGFALQNTLNNFAAGVMILLNHPFRVEDDVEVAGIRGFVKSISMSNTRLITSDRVKVTLPNAIIWNSPIQNHTAYKNLEPPG